MNHHKRKGFTIVELLIVIVVIGILAGIVIVAFNGVQQRARESTAHSALTQAKRKLALYQVDHGSYPANGSLSLAGISDSDGVTYQYTGGTTTFCLTATITNTSYNISQTTTPVGGACVGHTNGGVQVITNLITNPNATSTTGFTSQGGGAGAATLGNDGGFSGSTYIRKQLNSVGTGGLRYGVSSSNRMTVTEGNSYTISVYIRASVSVVISPRIQWFDSSDTSITTAAGSNATVNSSWSQVSRTLTAPAGATAASFLFITNSTLNTGDYVDMDALLFTEGSTIYNYADGSSPGWSWSGAANASTSSGPAQ